MCRKITIIYYCSNTSHPRHLADGIRPHLGSAWAYWSLWKLCDGRYEQRRTAPLGQMVDGAPDCHEGRDEPTRGPDCLYHFYELCNMCHAAELERNQLRGLRETLTFRGVVPTRWYGGGERFYMTALQSLLATDKVRRQFKAAAMLCPPGFMRQRWFSLQEYLDGLTRGPGLRDVYLWHGDVGVSFDPEQRREDRVKVEADRVKSEERRVKLEQDRCESREDGVKSEEDDRVKLEADNVKLEDVKLEEDDGIKLGEDMAQFAGMRLEFMERIRAMSPQS